MKTPRAKPSVKKTKFVRTKQTESPLRLRKRAEVLLKERPFPAPASYPANGKNMPQRSLHELQVYQVELEMQNAELQEARDRAELLLQKYTHLYDFAPVGYFSLDRQGRIFEVNLTGAALIGSARSHLLSRRFQQSVTPADRPSFSQFLEQVFAKPAKQVWETKLVTDKGNAFWAHIQAVVSEASSGGDARCQLAVSDISALKRSEAAQRRVEALTHANAEANREIARRRQLEATLREGEETQRLLLLESQTLHAQVRHLARHILVAQEEERRIISRELHDEIAQVLTGITVNLASLTGKVTVPPREFRRRVEKARSLVTQSIEVVRRFARELRPSTLDDLGLIPALRSHIAELAKRSRLHIELLAFAEVENLDNASKTVLYRVAQEALTNVGRHARATKVGIRIKQVSDGVRMEVSDDGRSFSVERMLASRKSGSLGLLGMRERVEMMEGRFTILSTPGTGTTVRAELPWNFPSSSLPEHPSR